MEQRIILKLQNMTSGNDETFINERRASMPGNNMRIGLPKNKRGFLKLNSPCNKFTNIVID